MVFMKLPVAVMAGALLSCAGIGLASAQAPGDTAPSVGRVYTLHTAAVGGGCPSLDWHIVVGPNDTLSGMIGADDMKVVFSVTGKYDPVLKTASMSGKEISGPNPGAPGALNAQVQSDGRLAASLGGLPVGAACQGKTVYVRWTSPQLSGGD